MDNNIHENHNSGDKPSLKPKIKIKVKKRGTKVIPPDAKMVTNIPEKDYFSDVSGVYYHFKKMEWRTICKDPFNNSRRWQKTYGINKYGFYQAKRMAEMKAHETTETNQFLKVLGTLAPNSIKDDSNRHITYFSPIKELGSRAKTPTDNWTHFSNNKNNLNQSSQNTINEVYNSILNQNDKKMYDNMNNNNINGIIKNNNNMINNKDNRDNNTINRNNSSNINDGNNNGNPYSNLQTYTNMVPMGGMKGFNGTFIDTGSYPYRIVILDNSSYSQNLNSSVQ